MTASITYGQILSGNLELPQLYFKSSRLDTLIITSVQDCSFACMYNALHPGRKGNGNEAQIPFRADRISVGLYREELVGKHPETIRCTGASETASDGSAAQDRNISQTRSVIP